MLSLTDTVEQLMIKNRRYLLGRQYTVPSPEIYPFQWFWDSCFHAIIMSHFDLASARAELLSVCSRPLPSGLIPHINYWKKPRPGEDWGREMRGDVIIEAFGMQHTSSLTQPPLVATALMRLYEKDGDPYFLEELAPTLDRNFQYLAKNRTFNGDDLVYIINPDESGEDNSPRFDKAQNLPAHHTALQNLERRIDRMRENVVCNFDAKRCVSKRFGIADTTFNILYYCDLLAMAEVYEKLRDKTKAKQYRELAAAVHNDLATLRVDGLYLSFDHLTGKHIDVLTWSIFLPLYAKLLNEQEAIHLVETYLLNPKHFATPYLLPTTALSERSYDPEQGFWRGPVWHGSNWFIYHGLKNYGFDDIAKEIKQSSLDLIEKSGFREQYHPVTGAGQGAHDFTWGGLVLDMN